MFPAPPAPPAPPGPPGPPNMGGASNKIVIQKKPGAPLPQELLDKSADLKAQIAATRGLTAQDIPDADAEFAPKMLQAIEEYAADKNAEYKKLMESLYTQYSKEELDDPLKPGEKIPLLTIRANPGTPISYIKFQETMETRLSALEKQNLSLIQLLKDAEAEAKLLYDQMIPY